LIKNRDTVLKVLPNRVWRTYSGGRMIDEIEGRAHPSDGPFPEDWIASTVRATNPGREDIVEGLSVVVRDGQHVRLVDLKVEDPYYYLGKEHVRRFGSNPMLLVKFLDSSIRLPFQVHPTPEFSRIRLNSESGKTEAYYVLSTRAEIDEPFIYLGFQKPPTRDELRRIIEEQDIRALENCFERVRVAPGDVFIVPGGYPHAIGPGVLMIEVMEPTDFVARIEFQAGSRTIPEPARFMGRDISFALDMFSFEATTVEESRTRWRGHPRTIEASDTMLREALIDYRTTDRFNITRTRIFGEAEWKPAGFTVIVVIDGSCTFTTQHGETPLKRFDRVVIPAGSPSLRIMSESGALLLESMPPTA